MQLLPATRRVIQQVEELSGKPVHLMEDRSLAVLTTVSTARRGAGAHVIRYQPSNEPIDYRITYQVGYTLRLFQRPRDQRLDFIGDDEKASAEAAELVRSGMDLTPTERELLRPFSMAIARWVLLRLLSLPVGLRIDAWIRATFPEMRSQQDAGMAEEQQQNLDGVNQFVERLSIPRHLAATSAAHALFHDRLRGAEWFAIPYRAMGLLEDGAKLVAINDEVPPDPEHDNALIDRWADQLGIRGWYRWVPYQP